MSRSQNEAFHSAFPDNIEAVRYDLEHEDVMLSARLVDAAAHGCWPQVKQLLADGADPRICRYTGGGRCKSALYFALKAEEFDIAEALLKAGDRLDDLRTEESDGLPGAAVNFLVRAAAHGKNALEEKAKPLSECIRCGLWAQTHEAMKSASRKELNLSVEMIGLHLKPWNAMEYLQILDELEAHGANLELLGTLRDELLPAILSLPPVIRAKFLDRTGVFITDEVTPDQPGQKHNQLF